ncbi:MAG TPA: GTPase [Desulfurococcales archaeon]|nr:GTPase [Desulfurococcales archaeon]
MSKRRKRIIIMGAAGRDFHNFNVVYRDNPEYEVVAFTASQIPYIENRIYPPELAGKLYPNGIPIYPEEKLPELIKKYNVDEVVLSYSDLLHEEVGHKYSIVLALGADFKLLGPKSTMLKSSKPVIAVCAVRTGAGKSTVSRKIAKYLLDLGVKVVAVRHPMPYGDLKKQIVQKFVTYDDLDKYNATIEEREEYEQYIEMGIPVYAGVDYIKILKIVEREAEVILWDGGNNDLPFYKPDLHIVVADPMRPGHEVLSYPGEANLRMADVVVINKIGSAKPKDVKLVENNVRKVNPKAKIIKADSIVTVDKPELVKGKRVLVIEDGPSVTHGGLPYCAGYVAAVKYGAKEIIDPRPYAIGSIRKAYEEYKHIGKVLPALGYSSKQIRELEETIKNIDADTVILGTPSHLTKLIRIDKPIVKVRYELKEIEGPKLSEIIEEFLAKHNILKR